MDKVAHALSTFNRGFGGGVGRIAKTSGAVTGAFMVVGLKYGRTQNDDKAAKNICPRERICLFFAKEHSSIECHELLACDISTPQGFRDIDKNDLLKPSV